jgi:hypothetical protein
VLADDLCESGRPRDALHAAGGVGWPLEVLEGLDEGVVVRAAGGRAALGQALPMTQSLPLWAIAAFCFQYGILILVVLAPRRLMCWHYRPSAAKRAIICLGPPSDPSFYINT